MLPGRGCRPGEGDISGIGSSEIGRELRAFSLETIK